MAFITGLIAVTLTYAISKKFKGDKTLMFVLAGISIAALFTAFTSTIKYLSNPYNQLPEITYWLMGSLSAVTTQKCFNDIDTSFNRFHSTFSCKVAINVLAMGDDEAASLGVDIETIEDYRYTLLYTLNCRSSEYKRNYRLGRTYNTTYCQNDSGARP